ncbi:Deoxycytidine monophosphate (dCMP) deaminase [Coniochaeta pulveracea]|uniref:Deoxycytidylate deaminase n=1 Tax=Coniochaeta pulveracea TaxID=177199 RepID=A0A420YDE2_9PEZI|nr:Deoxycytidine monophosphate (dCMP) deaminase [Coniochaeta pulveracea]
MFIGICGSICAGRATVAQYLIEHHGFKFVYVYKDSTGKGQNGTENGTAGLPQDTACIPLNGDDRSELQPQELSVPKLHPRHMQGFPSTDALLEFITKRWRQRWVTTDIASEAILDMYSRRPFFLLISIDAPLGVRLRRHLQVQGMDNHNPSAMSLEDFAAESDNQLYDPKHGQITLMSRASVRLINTSPDLAHLYATLSKVDLINPDRLRPSWDTYFMALASLAAQRSNCMKRRVGCVLVREKRVISTGYNGTPRGLVNCSDGGCGRCNDALGSGHGLTTCLCLHAEENALLEAGRERIREGAILYCDTCPCLTCSIKIAQVGIGEVVYSQGYSMDGETADVFRQAGVKLRQFVPPPNGLIHLEKLELY